MVNMTDAVGWQWQFTEDRGDQQINHRKARKIRKISKTVKAR
jgi:hypothetical protein